MAAAVDPSRIYLIAHVTDIARRRRLLPDNTFLEAWPDLHLPGHAWVGSEAKALLDSVGEALPAVLSIEGSRLPIYYGSRLTALDGLPTEESLRARVLSAGGIAAAWITLDRFGHRNEHRPGPPSDPVFTLRRPRTAVSHLWRLFRTRDEARAFLGEFYGNDDEAREWAARFDVATYAELLERHARREDATS